MMRIDEEIVVRNGYIWLEMVRYDRLLNTGLQVPYLAKGGRKRTTYMSTFSFKIEQFTCILSNHAKKIAQEKGFVLKKVLAVFGNPRRVYPSKSHPGQHRITGDGLCLVGIPDDNKKEFLVITIYQDEVITAPRPDQLKTSSGRIYADRYKRGLGRSNFLPNTIHIDPIDKK